MINGAQTENAFNKANLYGYGYNYANLIEKEMANSVSQGGLNNVKQRDDNIIANNPHTNLNELTNLYGFGKDFMNKTNYKPTIIDRLQYIQPPTVGYNNNKNLKILESIQQTQRPPLKHNVIGAQTSLFVDYKYTNNP